MAIPYRIAGAEPDPAAVRTLTGVEQVVLHCLYSRNCDGRVRERHLASLVDRLEPWVIPFVLQLAGEYVLEILEALRRGLGDLTVRGSAQRRRYGEFITRNPAFFARTERRVVSYWSCYYRLGHPEFGTYPGCDLLEVFRAAAFEFGGRRPPRNTPPPLPSAAD
ncbi:hypothetical protein [Glycomyces sp. NRRL B-16210]|uniref:hypothetical protein n=1 Tax=Glycomyces sp. NRRL B-16210 TaxID=1463821 RepID=UPI0018CC760A|nr:hypothetical protein [Glycomyces sp. NRRL B-16210]